MLQSGLGRFIHLSDTHYDPYFDPRESMAAAVCHSCKFSRQVFGRRAYCPTALPSGSAEDVGLVGSPYPFGRYGCNPPYRLIRSLYAAMKVIDEHPKFVVLTGDVAPHGYPDDLAVVNCSTKLEELCPTKLLIMRQWVQRWRAAFPRTKLVFTLGNNDHFPKNAYWQPFIDALGQMLFREGVFTQKEHQMFVTYGSVYYDIDALRFIALDFSLFMPNGEVSCGPSNGSPVRERTLRWLRSVLQEAREAHRGVYLIGHQPMTTKKGKDELEVEAADYVELQSVLADHADIIRAGLFGHRNLAGIQPIMGPLGQPSIPSITVPGVSPRGRNLPSFNVVFHSKDGTIQDFEQWIFDLGVENAKALAGGAAESDYLGEWQMHHRDLYSWRAFSHGQPFTVAGLMHTMKHITTDERLFFAIQLWKKAGYIGDETPENYECKVQHGRSSDMMKCLFPHQDPRCWVKDWLR